MKIEKLIKCIDLIKNERIRKSAVVLVELLPDYFFTIAASSTGKYHPNYALGEGGLLRHTKAAVKIANELLNNNSFLNFSETEKDLCLLSIMIHDGLKLGHDEEKWTRFDHPLLIADFVRNNKSLLFLKDEEIEIIASAVSSHMGQWNTDFKGNTTLPIPMSEIDKFVHMCDFLASRKFIEVDMGDL